MDRYPDPGPSARRPFIISRYRTDPAGRWAPELPVRCPLGIGAEEACEVHVDHFRPQKTGPRHPVLVARCGTHEVGFTVYPAGHVPYGRIAVAPVEAPVVTTTAPGAASAANKAAPAGAPRETTREDGLAAWRDTAFGAALDAADGVPWTRSGAGEGDTWSTQGRRVAWGLALLGLDPTFPASARVVASAILGVPGLVLEAAAREAGAATGYRGRGRAITTVLAEVPAPALHRVLAAGHAADLWGEPIVDDGRALRSLAFPGAARGPPQGET